MDANQMDLLEAAGGTGEVFIVIYAGGRAPGHKRRITVQALDRHADQMTVIESGARRTYLISKTTLVDESHPAPWMPEDTGNLSAVDPAEYFRGWAFTIRPELYAALGVVPRYIIDEQKTRLARTNAIERGMPKTEATRRIRLMKREIVVHSPPRYQFQIGDVFYRGSHGGSDWAQVMAVSNGDGLNRAIEAHYPCNDGRMGFSITETCFADCLRTGRLPDPVTRIGLSERTCLALLLDSRRHD